MIRLRFLDCCCHSRLPILHRFSSLSVSQEALSSPRDQHLLKAIRTQFDRDIQQVSEPIPRPPEPFKIIQKNGIRLLRRTYGAEEIFVKGEYVKYVPAGPKLREESDDDEVEEMVRIVVSIHKTPKEPVLEIDCLSDGNDIVVCRLACVEQQSASNTYFGREEFCRRIQKGLWKFLHRRAINKDMASYLLNYLSHKDSRQFLVWLKHVEGFIVSFHVILTTIGLPLPMPRSGTSSHTYQKWLQTMDFQKYAQLKAAQENPDCPELYHGKDLLSQIRIQTCRTQK